MKYTREEINRQIPLFRAMQQGISDFMHGIIDNPHTDPYLKDAWDKGFNEAKQDAEARR